MIAIDHDDHSNQSVYRQAISPKEMGMFNNNDNLYLAYCYLSVNSKIH